jgi:hypothetical protein
VAYLIDLLDNFLLMSILLTFSHPAFAGTKLKIYSASVDDLTLTLNGINFPIDSIEIVIGSNILTNSCTTINENIIECNLNGTPVADGGTWTVSITAGRPPAMFDEIDVFIPVGFLTVECQSGEVADCYSGDPSTIGVGECQKGTKTCIDGSWSPICEGEITPVPEFCIDSLDNDCDGVADEVCLGAPCSIGGDCESGYCVDGVCCNQPCSGQCEACVESLTGWTSGECMMVLDGTDPDGDCQPGETCSAGACESP